MGWTQGTVRPLMPRESSSSGGSSATSPPSQKRFAYFQRYQVEHSSYAEFFRNVGVDTWSSKCTSRIVGGSNTKSLCRYEANQATKRSWFLSFTRDVLKPRSLIGPRLISRSPGVGRWKGTRANYSDRFPPVGHPLHGGLGSRNFPQNAQPIQV